MAKAPERPRRHPELPKEIEQYLFDTENVKLHIDISIYRVAKQVWILLAGLTVWTLLVTSGAWATSGNVEWYLGAVFVFAPAGYLIWELLDLEREVFIVTDRRLMLVYGVITRRVAIMPLGKVTDMEYKRTPIGKLLNYGTFIFESAGQDQALSRVDWIVNPDQQYRAISSLIFAPPSRRAFDKLLPQATGSALPVSEPEDAWWKR